MSRKQYMLRRTLYTVFMLWVVLTLSFFLLVPYSPFSEILTPYGVTVVYGGLVGSMAAHLYRAVGPLAYFLARLHHSHHTCKHNGGSPWLVKFLPPTKPPKSRSSTSIRRFMTV
jgi:hypothetical protein